MVPRRVLDILLIAALLAAWLGADEARRRFVKGWFPDGAVANSAPIWTVPPDARGLEPAARARVVLLDGLTAAAADRLPRLSEICPKGQVLDLDVGFPTVSLPIQHVLWTGLTPQQSGLQYHIGKLPTPPAHALPPRVDSVAVAESHPEIVHSFGFTSLQPPTADKPDPTAPDPWLDAFPDAAVAAFAGPARLAFVHVLRIDDAGHAAGAASPAYAAAAAWSDDLLARLWAAAPADPQTRWFILADHGHRPAGGHGGVEPEVRFVRACVVGGVEPGPARGLHMVDLARALADTLAVPPAPEAVGRPWSAALADPAPNATLPRQGVLPLALAGLLVLAGLLLPLRRGHPRPDRPLSAALGLLWPLLGYLTLTLVHGPPSLSNPAIFPPQGRDMLITGVPGYVVLAVLAALAVRRGWAPARVIAAALGPWLGFTAAVHLLAHTPQWLLGGPPPLMPWPTPLASLALAQGRLACLVLAAVLTLAQLWSLIPRARKP